MESWRTRARKGVGLKGCTTAKENWLWGPTWPSKRTGGRDQLCGLASTRHSVNRVRTSKTTGHRSHAVQSSQLRSPFCQAKVLGFSFSGEGIAFEQWSRCWRSLRDLVWIGHLIDFGGGCWVRKGTVQDTLRTDSDKLWYFLGFQLEELDEWFERTMDVYFEAKTRSFFVEKLMVLY